MNDEVRADLVETIRPNGTPSVPVAELIRAIEAAATQDEISLVLGRWALMGVGVSACWWLTRSANARCLTVHR